MSQNQVVLNLHIPATRPERKERRIAGGAGAPLRSRDRAVFAVIQDMIAWIEIHLEEALSVKRICSKSGYSIWHFQRKFAQLTGLNIYTYVRVRRVINASWALMHTNRPILDIAVENGFNCQASFTRTVRNLTGYTPGRIRREFVQDEEQWLQVMKTLITPLAACA
ncbi:helix-turn-helix domain-containing protein [Pantoea septica]|uniref:helix-turn-helix domain-containing protein n=1 Tax=Pantoea septica TaxID=472695 RepID=UPI00289B03C4|nr:helix-turn-helix domain-containing protein [Pantoea septica]